jgi:CubicO group peptidase (beta-lactamase class C family)
MRKSILNDFCLEVYKKNLGVYGIHLYVEGKKSVEYMFRDNCRVQLFSASKTFTSMAVADALDKNLFSLSDKALSFFPQFEKSSVKGAQDITIKDLLQMRAGHKTSLITTFDYLNEANRDWAELFFAMEMENPAGTKFFYDNGCSYMLSRIIEVVSGKTLRDYLMPCLFNPLDIINPQWHTCPHGHTIGAFGLYLTTEELSRLGILLLNEGTYNNAQLFSKEYIRNMHSDFVKTEGFDDNESKQGYGYQVWVCSVENAYRLDGKYGQYSIIFPKQKAVVTITAHNEICAYDILRAVYSKLLPLISS